MLVGKMELNGICELHLSYGTEKPMDIFGQEWVDHHIKIKENWENIVNDEDTVLISGDISWGLRLENAIEDLKWIDSLPGRKICIKGNHDYWWQSLKKIREEFPHMLFLQNNHFVYNDYAICGARGWSIPSDNVYQQEDEKLYKREAIRLEMSLKEAKKAGFEKIIVLMHYPPTWSEKEENLYTQLFDLYNVETIIYAHLH